MAQLSNQDRWFHGYLEDISVSVDTDCGGDPSNSNQTILEISGFHQFIHAEDFSAPDGTYGVRVHIVGDWESDDFMRALKDARRLFKLTRAENKELAKEDD